MKKIILLAVTGLFIIPLFSQTEFEKAVTKHLTSIDERNYKNFESTVTDENNINLILPNGVHISSRTQFLEFIKAWFQETTWEMKYTILSMRETSEMGFVLLMVNYSDLDADNKPYSLVYYLNLIFEKQAGQWKLVHDQNTMCYDKNKRNL